MGASSGGWIEFLIETTKKLAARPHREIRSCSLYIPALDRAAVRRGAGQRENGSHANAKERESR